MDERELRMAQDEDAEAAERTDPPGAAMEAAAWTGDEPTRDGGAGGEASAQNGLTAKGDEPERRGATTGEKEPEQARAAAGEEETEQSCEAAGGAETVKAAGGSGNSEAAWRLRAESYALRAVLSEARAAAAAMGVPENRLNHVAKLSDLSGIDPEDEGAPEQIARAVRAVLRELPEFHGGVGTGQTAPLRRPRRDAFERGFLGE